MGDVEDARLGAPGCVDQLGDCLLWGAGRVGEERRDVELDAGQGLHHVEEGGAQVGALSLKQERMETINTVTDTRPIER